MKLAAPIQPPGFFRSVMVLGVAFAVASPLAAQFILPTSYTASAAHGQAQGGSWNYFDDTGTQLTDKVFGVNDWTADLGHGNAWEWVGWISYSPNITFNFSGNPGITAVTIGLSRAESAGIYLPPTVIIGGQTFNLSRNAFPDQSRKDVTFTLAQPFFGSQLTVTFADNVGLWTFVDEIQFVTPVPEPSTLALLGAGVLVFASWCWRRKKT